jgi:hypothetical protein
MKRLQALQSNRLSTIQRAINVGESTAKDRFLVAFTDTGNKER